MSSSVGTNDYEGSGDECTAEQDRIAELEERVAHYEAKAAECESYADRLEEAREALAEAINAMYESLREAEQELERAIQEARDNADNATRDRLEGELRELQGFIAHIQEIRDSFNESYPGSWRDIVEVTANLAAFSREVRDSQKFATYYRFSST